MQFFWFIYAIYFVYFIYTCDVTCSFVWCGAYMTEEIYHAYGSSLIYVTWLVLLIHICNVISVFHLCMWRDWFICVTWRIHDWRDMSHIWILSHTCHVTCSHGGHVQEYLDHKINTLDMTHPYVWHAASSFIYVTWLIYMGHDSFIWDMTHLYGTWPIQIRHDSSFIWMMIVNGSPIHTQRGYMWHDSFIWDMTHPYV